MAGSIGPDLPERKVEELVQQAVKMTYSNSKSEDVIDGVEVEYAKKSGQEHVVWTRAQSHDFLGSERKADIEVGDYILRLWGEPAGLSEFNVHVRVLDER